jgi:hypothetical protein
MARNSISYIQNHELIMYGILNALPRKIISGDNNHRRRTIMLGPASSPIGVIFVIFLFFWGVGYLCYLFGKMDAKTSDKSTGF